MANPYTSVSVSGYNSNPPADDGSQVASNEIEWAKHKDKLGDPLKTAIEAIDSNVNTAFDDILLNARSAISSNYTVTVNDRGAYLDVSGERTISLPAAATATSGFAILIKTDSSDNPVTVDPDGSETVNGAATLAFLGLGVFVCDGSNWFGATLTEGSIYSAGSSASFIAKSDQSSGTVGEVRFVGQDDGGNNQRYAGILGQIADNTGGSEDGKLTIQVPIAGTLQDCFVVDPSGTGFIFDNNRASNCVAIIKSQLSSSQFAQLQFNGHDSAAGETLYCGIGAYIEDNTAGSEDGYLRFDIITAGSFDEKLRVNNAGIIVTGDIDGDTVSGDMMATAAEIKTGTATDIIMSPANFAGNKDLSADGYYTFPGGFTIQWGDEGSLGSNGTQAVTFPTAFTTVYAVVVTNFQNAAVNDSMYIDAAASTTGFTARAGGSGADGFYWIAVGTV